MKSCTNAQAKFALLTIVAAGHLIPLAQDSRGAGKDTPVKITFEDKVGDRLRSDGNGPYTDVVDKVAAVIHSNGRLDFYSGSFTKADKRAVFIDFTDVVHESACNPSDTTELPSFNCHTVFDSDTTLTWVRIHTPGDVNLLAMTPGSSAAGGFFVKFFNACPGGGTSQPWFIAFQNDGTDWPYSCDPPCSAQVQIKALDNNPAKGVSGTGVDTWEISAEVGNPGAAQACLLSGDEGVLREIVSVTFHLTVQLK